MKSLSGKPGLYRGLLRNMSASPHTFTLLILIGLALVLPSLGAGLFADDFLHMILANEIQLVQQPDNLSLFHLFSFIDSNPARRLQLFGYSIIPWWVSQDFTLLFFRPLSELTHIIDYRWLTSHIWLMHLHSIAWYGAMLYLLARFYRAFCPERHLAILAFLFFIADATHGFTVGWLANRNAIIAAVFSLAAILLHHHYRETGKTAFLPLSLTCITASFLSAETGIVVGVFLLAYALFLDRAGPVRGLLNLLPALAIFLCWITLYKHYGYGAYGNKAYYVDPLSSPALFLQNLPAKLLHSLAIHFNPLPVHLIKPFPVLMNISGIIYLTLLLIPVFTGSSRHYRFFLTSLLLCIIPITSAELQDRNMLFTGIASAPLLAFCIRHLHRHRPALVARAGIFIILFFHLLVSGLLMLPTSYAPKIMAQSSITAARSLPADITSSHVITLGIPMFDASYLAAIRRTEHRALPLRLWNVTTQNRDMEIKKSSSHRFIIRNPHGLLGGLDFMLRDMAFDPINTGERFNLDEALLTITRLNTQGTPVEAIIDISPTVNPDSIDLYWYNGRELEPFSLAEGESRSF